MLWQTSLIIAGATPVASAGGFSWRVFHDTTTTTTSSGGKSPETLGCSSLCPRQLSQSRTFGYQAVFIILCQNCHKISPRRFFKLLVCSGRDGLTFLCGPPSMEGFVYPKVNASLLVCVPLALTQFPKLHPKSNAACPKQNAIASAGTTIWGSKISTCNWFIWTWQNSGMPFPPREMLTNQWILRHHVFGSNFM